MPPWFLQEENPDKKVVLVSKDICLRLKAKSLNLFAEDYETGKIKNVDELYTGRTVLNKVADKLLTQLKKQDILPNDVLDIPTPTHNQFYILNGKKQFGAHFLQFAKREDGKGNRSTCI